MAHKKLTDSVDTEFPVIVATQAQGRNCSFCFVLFCFVFFYGHKHNRSTKLPAGVRESFFVPSVFNQKSLIKNNKKKTIWDCFNSYSKPAGHSALLKCRVNGHTAALSLENRTTATKTTLAHYSERAFGG